MVYYRQDLAKFENLELAWKRIQVSTGYEYKQLSEDIFLAFGCNLDQNLKCLSSEIKEKIYKPIRTSKYYRPKKSNLVRPITLLSVKDQIYYQAIANLLSNYHLNSIFEFRRSNVFGGFNVEEPNGIFYLSNWKKEYQLYKEAIKSSYEDGYIWLGKFDLASFYDIIDHKVLIEVSSYKALDEDLKDEFFIALQTWTQPQAVNFSHSHGIPQGPVASQILADIYLHFLDTKIIQLSFLNDLKYFRYVDDIVLMSKTEKTAKETLIKLDIAARELALIPQSGKTSVRKIENIKTVLKGENSIFNFLQINTSRQRDNKRQQNLKKLLLKSVKADEDERVEVLDDTEVKYSLNKLMSDSDVSTLVMKIVKSYPYLTESCVLYFSRCEIDRYLSEEILNHIEEEPIYDWHTAKLFSLGAKLDAPSKDKLFSIAIKLLQNHQKHWLLKQEIVKFIVDKNGIYQFIIKELEYSLNSKKFASELPYCLTLLKFAIELNFERTIEYIENNIINVFSLPDDFYLFLGFRASLSAQKLPKTLSTIPWVSNNLFLNHSNYVDGISHNLVEFYALPEGFKYEIDFRDYLGDEYQAALDHLVKARGLLEKDPNIYFSHTDNFNQIILFCLYSRDSINIGKYELGNMISKLKNHIPYAFSGFDKCHCLRGEAPEIHAYSESRKSLNVSSSSRFRERDKLKPSLKVSYEALLEYIKDNHLTKLPHLYYIT